MPLAKPLWLTKERLRLLREEDDPIAEEPNPEDPDWENVPKPDRFIMIRDDGEGDDSTELGEITGKIRILSWKGHKLVVDDYIERSGNEVSLNGREYKTSAVAIYSDGGTTIIRFVPNILVEDLLGEWA